MTKQIAIVFFLILFVFPITGFAQGNLPQVYVALPEKAVAPGSEFPVTLFLRTDSPINAVSLEVQYTVTYLDFLGSTDAQSVVSIWKDRPFVSHPGTISLTGGMTGAFTGQDGIITELHFRAHDEGTALISVRNVRLYAADGKGTEFNIPDFYLRLPIDRSAPRLSLVRPIDPTPPLLEASLEKNPADAALLIVFQAHDKESGIQSITARTRSWIAWSDWRAVNNPFAPDPGVWAVEVRAANDAGNYTAQILYAWPALFQKIALVFACVAVIAFLIMYNRRRKLRV